MHNLEAVWRRTGPALLGNPLLSRRGFCASLLALVYMTLRSRTLRSACKEQQLAALEQDIHGTLGVSVRSLRRGIILQHRCDKRFSLCSTHKILTVAAILIRADNGTLDLRQQIKFGRDQVVSHSPKTEKFAEGPGMTIADLCAASICYSDNTAANLLMARLGGPNVLTSSLRSWGDKTTRIDSIEPEINDVGPLDVHDTTTPAAMTSLLQHLFRTPALSTKSQALLRHWMVHNTTGHRRLRAGLAKDWQVGDKTGSGPRNATHDVAVAWLPNGDTLFVAAYLIDSSGNSAARETCLANVGRLISASA